MVKFFIILTTKNISQSVFKQQWTKSSSSHGIWFEYRVEIQNLFWWEFKKSTNYRGKLLLIIYFLLKCVSGGVFILFAFHQPVFFFFEKKTETERMFLLSS